MSGPVKNPLRRSRCRRNVSPCGWDLRRSSYAERTVSVEGHGGRVAGRFTGSLALCLAAASLAACSSPESAATTTETTALPPPATTAAPIVETTSTAPPASTSTSSTSSPTTLAPTTTDAPPSADEEVRVALIRVFDDFSACLTALPFCDPSTLEATRAGDLLARNVARVNEWNAAGYAVRDRDLFRFVVEDVDVAADGTAAIAIVCIADGSKLVLPAADGDDVIIDDEFVSGREAWEMRLDPDGLWRAYAAPGVGATSGTDLCG